MKINFGQIIPWILVLLLGSLFVLYLKGCFNPKPVAGVIHGQPVDSAFFWKNKAGEAITSLKAVEAQFAETKAGWLDSVARVFGAKEAKDVKEVVALIEQGKTTLPAADETPQPAEIFVDSGHTKLQSVSQTFQNPWYHVKAFIALDPNVKSYAQVLTHDSLTMEWKDTTTGNIFHRQRFLQLDLKNSNPYNIITSAQAYRLPAPPPKKWAIGLFFGYGYGFTGSGGVKPYPVIGAGVMRTFIRF